MAPLALAAPGAAETAAVSGRLPHDHEVTKPGVVWSTTVMTMLAATGWAPSGAAGILKPIDEPAASVGPSRVSSKRSGSAGTNSRPLSAKYPVRSMTRSVAVGE